MDTLSLIAVMQRIANEATIIDDSVKERIGSLAYSKSVSVEDHRQALRDLSWSLNVLQLMSTTVLAHAVTQEERIAALESAANESKPKKNPVRHRKG